MRAKLEKIKLVTPKAESLWTGPPPQWQHPTMDGRSGQNKLKLQLQKLTPFFLHQPKWHHIQPEQANAIAVALGEKKILTSALKSEISDGAGESSFHEPVLLTSDADGRDSEIKYLPRIVPYRPERYGLTADDFDNACVIDVHLSTHRDETGRFAYSAEQLSRWDVLQAEIPIAGGSWVPSATFPPDVPSMKDLPGKFEQLRALSPAAALFVTLDPFHLQDDLNGILSAKPDGIILQLDALQADGFEIAKLVVKARSIMDHSTSKTVPLWVSPGEIDADDAAKLISLGASGIAIDRWFNELWDEIESTDHTSYAPRNHFGNQAQRLADEMEWYVSRTMGLLHSLERLPPDQRLTSFDKEWCDQLGLFHCNALT